MSADLAYLLTGLTTATALEALARIGPPRLRPWARGLVLWSGLFWLGQALLLALALVIGDAGADMALRDLGEAVWMGLLLGGGFFAGGHAVSTAARRLDLVPWARHGLVLASTLPAVWLGYAVHLLLQSAVFGDALFWGQVGIGGAAVQIAFWIIGNLAVAVALVRLLYDLRADAAERRQRDLDAERTAARLAVLEARLRPHALLNALGGLAGLIRTDPDAAEAMTLALARLLRRTLDAPDTPLVSLADELALAEDTLAVERHRLGDRLRVTLTASPETRALAVPRFVLQPLVENAVKHGAARTTEPVHVAVRAAQQDGRLRLEVEDDGPPFADGWTGGVGLTSVTERLDLIYGDAASLRIDTAPKRVVLDLPAHPSPLFPAAP